MTSSRTPFVLIVLAAGGLTVYFGQSMFQQASHSKLIGERGQSTPLAYPIPGIDLKPGMGRLVREVFTQQSADEMRILVHGDNVDCESLQESSLGGTRQGVWILEVNERKASTSVHIQTGAQSKPACSVQPLLAERVAVTTSEDNSEASYDLIVDGILPGVENHFADSFMLLRPGGSYVVFSPTDNTARARFISLVTRVLDRLLEETVSKFWNMTNLEKEIRSMKCVRGSCVFVRAGYSDRKYSKRVKAADNGLREIGAKFGTDKVTAHKYNLSYGMNVLQKVRDGDGKPLKFLEIGLGCDMHYGPGKSVGLWKTVLPPKSTIYMMEIDAACVKAWHQRLLDDGVNAVAGDQGQLADLKSLIDLSGGDYDFMVDDGGHQFHQQILSIQTLFDCLRPGGTYFIEDLHTSFIDAYKGGVNDDGHSFPHTSAHFVKSLLTHLISGGRTPAAVGANRSLAQNIDEIECIDYGLCAFRKKLWTP